jgi:hypothetical protein
VNFAFNDNIKPYHSVGSEALHKVVKIEFFCVILQTVMNVTYSKFGFEYLDYQENKLNLKITLGAHIQYFIYEKQADT